MTHSRRRGLQTVLTGVRFGARSISRFRVMPALTQGIPLRRFWAGTALIGPRSRAVVLIGLQ
jgi:hypothetical protein